MNASSFRRRRDEALPTRTGDEPHPSHPITGDIVVGPVHGSPGRFGLRQLPHEYEILEESLSACVSTGRRFATAHRVDIWSIDARGHTTLIERNRLGRPRHDA